VPPEEVLREESSRSRGGHFVQSFPTATGLPTGISRAIHLAHATCSD